MRHLYFSHGHREFALICGGEQSASCGSELYRGFVKVLAEQGLEFDENRVIPSYWSAAPLDHAEKLVKEQGVTAFLCENDALAARLIVDLKRRGISVPGDVAVIGNGCSFISELTSTPLTSLYLPVRMYDEKAFEMALAKIAGRQVEQCQVECGIFIGGSCGCTLAELPQMYWEGVPLSLEDQASEIKDSERYKCFMENVIFQI